jgi:hypothetical protein
MSQGGGHEALLGPTAVAIHDDCHVAWECASGGVVGLTQNSNNL